MKQTLAVIGTDNIFIKDFVMMLSKGNYRIMIYSNDKEQTSEFLNELKRESGSVEAEAAECKVDASWESDIILFALPGNQIGEAALQIKEVACRKTIIVSDPEIKEGLKSFLPNSLVITAEEFKKDVIDGH
jgi:8-hydroxy-5-deazaflavin:NADPH oxidoreductase